jgi:hypothetical protein
MQLGETSRPDYPPDSISKFKNRVTIRNLLARVGFESLQVYDEVSSASFSNILFRPATD